MSDALAFFLLGFLSCAALANFWVASSFREAARLMNADLALTNLRNEMEQEAKARGAP